MATVKEIIADVLESTGVEWAYYMTDKVTFPRFSYHLVSSRDIWLGNKKHSKKMVYQIDYFTTRPVNVQGFQLFETIANNLKEKNMGVGSWQEVAQFDDEKELSIYHYYVIVRS